MQLKMEYDLGKFKKGEWVEIKDLLGEYEDQLLEVERLKEEIEDIKQNVEDNYERIPVARQVDVSERDFI